MNTKRDFGALEARFDSLLERHVGILFRVVRTYCRAPEDQLDLAQEIRVQLWRAFGKFDEGRRFSTWMYRIALNCAISWTRQIRREHLPLDEAAAQVAPDPSNELRELYELIDGLDPMNRALLLLYLEDISYAEIGEILGISAGNVATKISRLKQQLRKEQEENHEH